MGRFFVFFLLSGFCSLVYQVVWLRIAMAQFGVTTPLVSIVLSVFMAGLALGSWGAGHLARRLQGRPARAFLRLYGLAELVIGISGFVVAPVLGLGRLVLASPGGDSAWGSGSYYLASGGWVALTLLPFCTCMGATFPLAMAGIRSQFREESARSFSYLYVANLLGAIAGTLASAFVLIEMLGFHRTLLLTAGINGLVATAAWIVSLRADRFNGIPRARTEGTQPELPVAVVSGSSALPLLFTSGFVSLAMEVVWARQFVPFQGTVVYAFACILAVYLAATTVGSKLYRVWARRRPASSEPGWIVAAILAGAFGLLPLLAADPRLPLERGLFFGALRVAMGLAPFCGTLGFLTSMLVDRWSGGDPERAGTAFAVNTLGCILGPLVSGFVLMPLMGERWTLALLSVPFFAFAAVAILRAPSGGASTRPGPTRSATWLFPAAAVASILLVGLTKDYETLFPQREVRRDHTATVIASGTGKGKLMLVNGVGITHLHP
ncbi:MAG: hypothetical protein HY049_10575 [Acidobacteria bacterium]|nr:hypothetical protein [Acidobacteriota bacterium]